MTNAGKANCFLIVHLKSQTSTGFCFQKNYMLHQIILWYPVNRAMYGNARIEYSRTRFIFNLLGNEQL